MSAAEILADDLQASAEVRTANAEKFSRSDANEECFLCGRPMSDKTVDKAWFIHLRASGLLAEVAASFPEDSQGCFPVGSECAKRVPLTHRARLEGWAE